tara:strand:+ start:14271 stop:14927 length:657 start_codon:yes stop_codon:yes gene_type:complete
MSNYLSFDVGIKNLSYCGLTSDKKITQWGIINLNENPICDVNLRKKCEKQSTYIVSGNETVKYCCTAHSGKFKKKKKLNANHDILKISQLCVSRLRELDLKDIKYVLIENQPALKNPVMKSIQMIIYTFFVIEGVMNNESTIEKIHMVNARNKLKVYKGPKIECNKKGKYAQNKYLSVEYTKIMIQGEDEKYCELFTQSKKKDDLADSYLQGIYWIEK